jgi:glycerophosphoryl diester phosphodiesterase
VKHHVSEPILDVRDPASIQARRPLLVAHRGGAIAPNAPENSLAAIQLAGIRGYDMVELDVQEARDGVPVLFHGLSGSILLADCGVERTIHELTGDELVEVRYRASTEHIATLAQALALCATLNLGVMLDIKGGEASEGYLRRIADLLDAHHLGSAAVTISRDPFVRDHLADRVLYPVSDEDVRRVSDGEAVPLGEQYWFGWAARLSRATVERLQQNGAFAIVSINTFHYPAHAHRELARQDVRRLLAAGVEGFQIDSVYDELFL